MDIKDIQKYMTSCNIYNTKIDEIIAFFSDKNKYNNSSHNEIQKVLDWHDILIRRFKNSKTYLEQSFNNRMKDLDNEDSTRYILPKMREYISKWMNLNEVMTFEKHSSQLVIPKWIHKWRIYDDLSWDRGTNLLDCI